VSAPKSHRHSAKGKLTFMVVTVSSSRFATKKRGGRVDDESGDLAQAMLEGQGHAVKLRELVSDDPAQIRAALSAGFKDPAVDAILLTGGTGVSTTDVTIETVRPLFEKEIEGFGEIFRSVSYAHIGAAAALSRATAGIASKKVVLCLPGSPDAVKTALNLFTEEIPHVVYLARGA
jgi:molybdopterin adenylyltransferase